MSTTPKLTLLGKSPTCDSCGHQHGPTRAAAATVTDRQLEVVMQQLRAHSIDLDPVHRVAYRRRSDGAYEKLTLREAILLATGRRRRAS